MKLVQLFLPLTDNADRPFDRSLFDRVFDELTEQFGGVTAYQRSPAEGAWKAHGGVSRDSVVTYEVMAQELDYAWWQAYRQRLEQRFAQDLILIRALNCEQL